MPFLSCCSLVAQRLAVLVLPSSLAASPPALFCSVLLQGPVHPCPLLHKLCFPGRLEEREAQCHATRSLRSWPWSQQLLLSPMPELLPLSHKMFSLCLVAPSLLSVPGRKQWDVRAGAPLERCPVPGLQAILGHVYIKDWGCFTGAQPCFCESFAYPLVPPAVCVASPSDPWAGFEASASLCLTWDMVLVRA